jgi:hypothetical protein
VPNSTGTVPCTATDNDITGWDNSDLAELVHGGGNNSKATMGGVWKIWKERNRQIFQRKTKHIHAMKVEISAYRAQWAICKRVRNINMNTRIAQ